MTTKNKFFVISGGSGVSETTLLRNLLEYKRSGRLEFQVPSKWTTRPVRALDDPEGLTYVSMQNFIKMANRGGFLIQFECEGYKCGIVHPEQTDRPSIQIIPAEEIAGLRSQIPEYSFHTLVLDHRNQHQLLSQKENPRDRTDKNKLLKEADYIIGEESCSQGALNQASHIIEFIMETGQADAKLWKPDIMESIQDAWNICHIASQQGRTAILFAGIVANLYGSNREITDIDILVDDTNFDWLLNNYAHEKLVSTDRNVLVDRVEVCRSPTHPGTGLWPIDEEGVERLRHGVVNGRLFRILSAEDMIVLKATWARGIEVGKYDIFDVGNILKYAGDIDFKYLKRRAQQCCCYEKVKSVVNSFGFSL